jgi:hypothetical protein
MAIAVGVKKLLVYKKETTWGTAAGASGANYLRRVTSDIDLTKDTYQSNEIASHQQIVDFRHGVKRVAGGIQAELSTATYAPFLAALCRKDFATGVSFTSSGGSEITSQSAGPSFTRASGSWLTDGFKVGDVVRVTNHSTAANNNKNYRIVTLTATVMTVAETVVTDAVPDATCTIAVTGKKTFIPTTGHTDDSFTIEHYYSDLDISEQFLGCKPSGVALSLPPTGMATANFSFMGQDRVVTSAGTAPYFTSPTADTSTGVLAAVNGTIRVGSTDLAIVTGLTINLESTLTGDPVVGSNILPILAQGRVRVTGQATLYFQDTTYLDAFNNETEMAMYCKLDQAGTDPKSFLNIVIPRIKLGGASKDDGEKALVQTIPFQALLNSTGGSGTSSEKTTISIQDSDA